MADTDENKIIIGDKTYDLGNVSDDEKIRLQHRKIMEEHKGHELMHFEMFFLLIIGIAASQCLLMYWKNRHYRSYQLCSLVVIVFIPPIMAIYSQSYQFLACCLVFLSMTSYITYTCTRGVITPQTPGFVYGWFLFVHNITYTVGVTGYILLFITIMTINNEFLLTLSFKMLLYGIYFGVVARDFAEVCSDKMATKIGYYSPDGITLRTLPPNTCSVCTQTLTTGQEDSQQELFQLNCSHSFHEKCIRGWCIIGKKDICPYCKEKVDLKNTFTNPWQKPHILYGNYLDVIRYMVGWQPIVLFLITQFNHLIGLK